MNYLLNLFSLLLDNVFVFFLPFLFLIQLETFQHYFKEKIYTHYLNSFS
jgi:hypothetical protein